MKRIFLILLLGISLASRVYGTSLTYNNVNGVIAPPQPYPIVDATNFFNNNIFFVAIASGDVQFLYDFSNVQNFTNRSIITNYPGLRFDTVPDIGARHRAKSFFNANNVNTNFNNTVIYGDSEVYIDATNVISRGGISSSGSGLIRVLGDTVDLSRSSLSIGSLGLGGAFVDQSWGFDTNIFNPNTTGNGNISSTATLVPPHRLVYADGTGHPGYFPTNAQGNRIPLNPNHAVYKQIVGPLGFDEAVTIVFVRTTDPSIRNFISFTNGSAEQLPVVRSIWSVGITNLFGQVVTNYLTLTDTYGASTTNTFVTNFVTGTFQPANFTLSTGNTNTDFGDNGSVYLSGSLSPLAFGTNAIRADIVTNTMVSGYGVRILASSADPSQGSPDLDLAGNARLLPGRLEIVADKVLNLNLARMNATSYALVSGTNHFAGNTNGVLSAPYADLRLGSTNGLLPAFNVVQPTVPGINGRLEIYSGVWSNSLGTNVGTGIFNVIYINAELTNHSPSQLLDVSLSSHFGTNAGNKGAIIIGDTFNIIGNFTVDASAVTLTTNGSITLSLTSGDWASNVPNLGSFTNFGGLFGSAGFSFLGRGLAPDGSDVPYTNFINSGTISNSAVQVLAQNFQNNGIILGGVGGVFVGAGTVSIPDLGTIRGIGSDINITALNLSVDNRVSPLDGPAFQTARALSLSISNNITVGNNFWSVGDGFNLYVKPTTGDFSLLTVTNTAAPFENVINTWAGEDRGASAAGYTDNAAIGRLILDGGANSAFTFADLQDGDGIINALYVDVLVLRNSATNLAAGNVLANVFVQPEMRLYYSHIFFDTTEVTGTIGGAGGGGGFTQFAHAGAISTASVPGSGSSGGGSYPANINLQITAVDATTEHLSWNTVAGANNSIYYRTSATGAWQFLGQFISGNTGVTGWDDNTASTARFYQVRVDMPAQ